MSTSASCPAGRPDSQRSVAGAVRLCAGLRQWREWGCALGLVAAWYALAQWAIGHFLGLTPRQDAWLRDLSAHLLIGGLLFLMARRVARFGVAIVVLFSAFTVGNAPKLAVLAVPALILDLLGDEWDTMLRFAARSDDPVRVRPLPSVHFTL